MGWLISIIMLLFGCMNGNDTLVIASGLFAIAGSIGGAMENFIQSIKIIKPESGE